MPTPTYIPLATKTLTASASSVSFSSISQDYRDLVLVCEGANNPTANSDFGLKFNSSSTGYSMVDIMGDGAGTESQAEGNTYADCGQYLIASGNARTMVIVTLPDYAQTDKHKNWLARNSAGLNKVWAVAGRWANTSAITSIQVIPSGGSLANGMTLTLYGIAG